MRKSFLLLILFLFSLVTLQAQIVKPKAKLILVNSGYAFTEGPATDKYGNVYFTDQPNDNIWKFDTAAVLSLFMHGAQRSNGMYFDTCGNLISCADEQNRLLLITPQKSTIPLVENFKGDTLNGPNDVWINPTNNNMYFTDPYFQRDYWARQHADSNLGGERVYFFSLATKKLLLADSTVKKPNGIVGTPDGKTLYVADMGVWKTYRYDIQADGTLTNKQPFADEASDGMTIDNLGNIYLTNNGVSIYNSEGKKIEHIDVPEKWTANICFAGKGKNWLFITASSSVYVIETTVHGVE